MGRKYVLSSANNYLHHLYTLKRDQLFNLQFQFKSAFSLDFQLKFGIQLGIPTLMGIKILIMKSCIRWKIHINTSMWKVLRMSFMVAGPP